MSTTSSNTRQPSPPGANAGASTSAAGSIAALPNPVLHGPVLFATDGGDGATAPAFTAAAIARRLRVPLDVVGVVDLTPAYVGMTEISVTPAYVIDEVTKARDDAVRRYVADTIGTNAVRHLAVRTGRIATEIAGAARETRAGLIVLGAAPHRRLRGTVAGARAAQVLWEAPCPVLSVAPGQVGAFRRAVCAVDFGAASIQAAHAALRVLDDCATMSLVHVIPALDLSHMLRDRSGTAFGGDVAAEFDRLIEELRRSAPPGVTFDTRVALGSPAEEVMSVVEDVGADLVVVGTHGPNLFERIVVGSVAARVMHSARCSVLASPPPSPADVVELDLRMEGSSWVDSANDAAAALDAFSRRNLGRPVTLEEDDPAFGARIDSRGLVLRGVTWDRHDGRIEIMLGAAEGGHGHLTRTIDRVQRIGFHAEPLGRDVALDIQHARGSTMLLFG
jgi:nucleotide-binding universal stress UspA family protein